MTTIKTIDKRTNITKRFEDVIVGQWFVFPDDMDFLYLKIEPVKSANAPVCNTYEAVDITGCFHKVLPADPIIPIKNLTLTIEQ